jgi:hypothetical protein
VPEGYAFYAVYPQLYWLAARRLAHAEASDVLVIGLRSIGTSLAAMVAAGARSPFLPVTVRPEGHPFERRVNFGRRLERLLLSLPSSIRYAIVDEGPGLSGSSFGAVADWLEDRGIAPERICFFPAHGNELSETAAPRHRDRWRGGRQHRAEFDELLLGRQGHGSPAWFEDDVPNAKLAFDDVTGGRWRALRYTDPRDWPPINPIQERRKYLYDYRGELRLAKFAGLGRYGEDLFERGRTLAQAGFGPPVRDLRQGFLIGPWLPDSHPPRPADLGDRSALVERLGDYLGFLSRTFPAAKSTRGATPAALLEMSRQNTLERWGPSTAALLNGWQAKLADLSRRARPVRTDNRLQQWEWLVLPDGRWLKADGLEHHAGHDCIGAQDLAWDIAGATIEFGLDDSEVCELERLLARHAGYHRHDDSRRFYRHCYLAFQMGSLALAAATIRSSQPDEAARLFAASERYASQLKWQLEHDAPRSAGNTAAPNGLPSAASAARNRRADDDNRESRPQ